MFEIEYKGANSVVMSTKKGSIVTDPKLSLVGLKDITIKDDVELATEARFALNSPEARIAIEGPGEYGVADFDIKGIEAQRHLDAETEPKASTMYRIEVSDFRVAVIGNVFEKLSEEQLEELGVIDVLIIPVGGNGYTLDATGAAGLVRKIDPKVVIPVHYADSGLKYEVPQDPVELFVKELGAPVEQQSKFKFKLGGTLPAVLTVIQLERN